MNGRRFVAVALPTLRITLARARAGSGPLAVVVARPGGSVEKETDLLGNTRLDDVSSEARALGVRPGQTIASARAKAASLRVRVVSTSAIQEELERLAETAFAFGATVSVGLEETHVLWIDVTGCAHLYGGEDALVSRLSKHLESMGHVGRIALADGPQVAAALARYGRFDRFVVVPPGKNADALRPLPLWALPLGEDAIAWLRSLGVRTVGGLQRLPRPALGNHLGGAAEAVMSLLAGEDRAPLVPYVLPETVEERVELEYGIASLDALLFVTKSLCDRVSARLVGRGMAAARLELVLGLDKALSSTPTLTIPFAPPSPLVRAADLFGVLRARLESRVASAGDSFDAPPPIRSVTLRVPELARGDGGRPLDLFEPEAKAEATLPRLVAELVAELGPSCVGTLRLANTWSPDRRTTFAPFGDETPATSRTLAPGTAPEPTRWLPESRPLDRHSLSRPITFTRLEAVEWWKGGGVSRRDYAVAWVEQVMERMGTGGVIYGPGWLELDRCSEQLFLKGWMD